VSIDLEAEHPDGYHLTAAAFISSASGSVSIECTGCYQRQHLVNLFPLQMPKSYCQRNLPEEKLGRAALAF